MCHQVIEHLYSNVAKFALTECYRILSSEGHLLIFSPSKYVKEAVEEETHINLYSPRTLKMELESVGFKIVRNLSPPRFPSWGETLPKR